MQRIPISFPAREVSLMNHHAKNFENRLLAIFEKRAEEFGRYSQEQPNTARVARQIADIYRDLAALMSRR